MLWHLSRPEGVPRCAFLHILFIRFRCPWPAPLMQSAKASRITSVAARKCARRSGAPSDRGHRSRAGIPKNVYAGLSRSIERESTNAADVHCAPSSDPALRKCSSCCRSVAQSGYAAATPNRARPFQRLRDRSTAGPEVRSRSDPSNTDAVRHCSYPTPRLLVRLFDPLHTPPRRAAHDQ